MYVCVNLCGSKQVSCFVAATRPDALWQHKSEEGEGEGEGKGVGMAQGEGEGMHGRGGAGVVGAQGRDTERNKDKEGEEQGRSREGVGWTARQTTRAMEGEGTQQAFNPRRNFCMSSVVLTSPPAAQSADKRMSLYQSCSGNNESGPS